MTLREKMMKLDVAIGKIAGIGEEYSHRIFETTNGYSDKFEDFYKVMWSCMHVAKATVYNEIGNFTAEEFRKAIAGLENISFANAFRYVCEDSRRELIKHFFLPDFEEVTRKVPEEFNGDFIIGRTLRNGKECAAFYVEKTFMVGADTLPFRKMVGIVNLRNFSDIYFPDVKLTEDVSDSRALLIKKLGTHRDIFDVYNTDEDGFLKKFPRYIARSTSSLEEIVRASRNQFRRFYKG